MAERLIVGIFEPLLILLNEIVGKRYSREVARALHESHWPKHYIGSLLFAPETPTLELFLQDSQRGQLFVDRMTEVLGILTERERRAVKMRFGFEDLMLHTLKEIKVELGFRSTEGPRLMIARSLGKFRDPSIRSNLEEFLSESPFNLYLESFRTLGNDSLI